MGNGVPTTVTTSTDALEELLGNSAGGTKRISVEKFATQLMASGPISDGLTSGLIAKATWPDLLGVTNDIDGAGGEVLDGDTGTHPQATATGYNGSAVPNSGRYSWVADWNRWLRVGSTGLSSKADKTETEAATKATADAAVIASHRSPDIENVLANTSASSTGATIQLSASINQVLTGVSVSLKLEVTGATYPDINSDPAFSAGGRPRVEVREGGTLQASAFLERAADTKIWYAIGVPVSGSGPHTEAKITVGGAPGVTLDVSEALITLDGGLPSRNEVRLQQLAGEVDGKIATTRSELIDLFTENNQTLLDFVQSLTENPAQPLSAIARCADQRVDFVGIGDSNQLFGGTGWDHGFQKALADLYPMYGTGLISLLENDGSGSSVGYGYRNISNNTNLLADEGAPADLNQFLENGTGDAKGGTIQLSPLSYGYVADGEQTAANMQCGMNISSDCPVDTTGPLNFAFWWGGFGSGSGSFRQAIRLDQPPYSVIASGAAQATNSGTPNAMNVSRLALAADGARDANLFFSPNRIGADPVVGPFFGTYLRVENEDRQTGFSYSTMFGYGSRSMRDMALAMIDAPDETIAHFFQAVRDGQRNQVFKAVVMCVNSGANDRVETNPSVGPDVIADGDGPTAYLDNFTALRSRIEQVWVAQGWSLLELYWIVIPTHPVSSPDDAELLQYRTAVSQGLFGQPRVQVIDLGFLTDEATMLASGHYNNGGADRNHLTEAGYKALASLIISAAR